jgi:hypothetical protein
VTKIKLDLCFAKLIVIILQSVISSGTYVNWAQSAVRLCHQATARVPDMICKYCLVKNHKIDHNSTTTKA